MSETLIIRHCAPTLAGIKTGNLFTVSYDSIDQLDEDIRRMNGRLKSKNLRIVRLRARDDRALIYVYRPGKLAADLGRKDARHVVFGKSTEMSRRRRNYSKNTTSAKAST